MTLRGYQKHIQRACECTDDEAPEVEEMMLDRFGALDSIQKTIFHYAAKQELAVLREIRRTDPKWSCLPSKCEFCMRVVHSGLNADGLCRACDVTPKTR